MKKFLIGAGIVILVLVVIFALTYTKLGFRRFFGPKFQNVEREIFDETKSYVHGKNQDLARYYRQYTMSKDEDERSKIAGFIRLEFGEFPAKNINDQTLRSFLIRIRGF